MNKNTVIAVVLSTLVVIATFFMQTYLFPNSSKSNGNSVSQTDENSAAKENVSESEALENQVFFNEENSALVEEQVFIKTNKADVILTNKGGDIISYKLFKHIDVETKDGVQMADNISETNRACALALGGVNSKIINELFNVEKIDDNTVLFTKRFSEKDADGNIKSFVLGKRYTFVPDEYMFKLDILIHADDEEIIKNNEFAYTLRTSPQIGPHFNPKLNRYENRQFISLNPNGRVKRQIINANQFKQFSKEYIWNGIAGKYFEEIIIPLVPETMDFSYYSTQVEVNNYANAQAILVRKPINVQDVQDSYYIYFGPRNEKDLKIYNTAENNFFKLEGQRLGESLQSSGWLSWLEAGLKWFLEMIYKLIPNWGAAIIIMTIILKLAMFPMTRKQSLSTLKMQELQPQIKKMQEKYKDSPQKQQEAMAKIYKESGYNPMSGCLPMGVQFLILFAMYNLFNNYFEFRGASFIPGWISDLSSGDSIHTFKFTLPFLGNQLRILPIIYLISQLLFGKITQNGGTAAAGSTQAQMNMMMYGMPIVFFFLFYNAPSGLLLYWTVSNLFQMGQQLVINNMMKEKVNAKS
ncbi:MAG: membrane protein insertase YidC [Treponema sp.]